ncbi:MAG TPA: RagB/SusD family nutrient uptake outer membrane protein [Sphingobacteriaceae bacterium]
MKKIYSLVLLFTLVGGSSCDKFLDTKPEDFLSPEYFYNNEQQVNSALVGIYGILSDTRNGAPLYSSSYFTFMGTEGDDGFYRKGPDRNVPGQFIYNASTTRVADLWRALYEGVNLANVMLEKLDGASMSEEKRAIVRGETLFLRSYYYFLLVSNWGDVPLKLTSTQSPNNNEIARTSSKVVYAQITQDMETAYDLVPTATAVGFGGRVNKSAVAGILARVYLHWAGEPLKDTSKYQNARDWAFKVIDSREHELNPSFEQVFINYAADKYDIKESIWEVEFYGNRTDRPRQAGMVGNYIGIVSSNDSVGRSNGNVQASARLYKLHKTGDLRRDWTIAPFYYSPSSSTRKVNYASSAIWNRAAGKYRREHEVFLPKSVGYTPINFPLLRYSDVLLMFAEAENQINNGPTPDAIKYVNMVRRRGFGFPVNTVNPISDLSADEMSDKAEFLQTIQDERSRELAFEALRKYDLIRWGIYVYSIKAMAMDYKASSAAPSGTKDIVGSLENIDTKHIFLPIPTHELMLNPKLTQNFGW